MKITEKEQEKLEDLFDYLYEDGAHHKQYALVEIAKIVYGKKIFEICYPDVDPGIPSNLSFYLYNQKWTIQRKF